MAGASAVHSHGTLYSPYHCPYCSDLSLITCLTAYLLPTGQHSACHVADTLHPFIHPSIHPTIHLTVCQCLGQSSSKWDPQKAALASQRACCKCLFLAPPKT